VVDQAVDRRPASRIFSESTDDFANERGEGARVQVASSSTAARTS
jgi:hypothetical protein